MAGLGLFGLEDGEVLLPGADGVAVLEGEDAGDLVDVGEVVDGPGGEEVGGGDSAEDGVNALEGELGFGEVE